MDLCQRSDLTKLTEGSGQDAGTQKKDEGAAGDDASPHALWFDEERKSEIAALVVWHGLLPPSS